MTGPVPPKFPTKDELETAERFAPGAALKLIDGYVDRLRRYEEECRQASQLTTTLAYDDARHQRNFRYLSLFAGFTLATLGFCLCAYMVFMHQDISKMGIVLGGIGGVAGVYIVQGSGRAIAKAIATRGHNATARRVSAE